MTTNARLIHNSRPGFATKEAALLEGVPEEMIVFATDEPLFFSEDDTVQCAGCEAHYYDRAELDDNLRCEECAQSTLDEGQHMKDLNADWSASRGCNMGRGW